MKLKEDSKRLLNSRSAMEDEIASMFQYPPYEYLERDFGCDFLCDFSNLQSINVADKPNRNSYNETISSSRFDHSPKSEQHVCDENNSVADFPPFSYEPMNKMYSDGCESSSMMTTGSSICLSSQDQNIAGIINVLSSSIMEAAMPSRKLKENSKADYLSERVQTDMFDVAGASSSGGSGVSTRGTPDEMSILSCKRKGMEVDESSSPSEEADYESADGKKPAQRCRRSRAAEVHNLSERKRRDRINEKMKALQDLIPHCTKSDKASMLDEAIEYLKSLQQQVQIMWMRSGMATMMFPSMQNFMAQMNMGISGPPLPVLSGLIRVPSVPMVNLPMPSALPVNPMLPICTPSIAHFKFQNQMHSSQTPESFPPHFGFHSMQPSPPQAIHAYGSQMQEHNQIAAIMRSSNLAAQGLSSPDNLQNGKTG